MSNLKIAAIKENFPTQLKTGDPVIYAVGEMRMSKIGMTYPVYVAQLVKNPYEILGKASQLTWELLGFEDKLIIRAIINISASLDKEKLEKYLTIGNTLPNHHIQLYHKTSPSYISHYPLMTNNKYVVNGQGKLVYELGELVKDFPNHRFSTFPYELSEISKEEVEKINEEFHKKIDIITLFK